MSLPFPMEIRNPLQLLWTVREGSKNNLSFAVSKVQGELFLASHTDPSDKFPYRNQYIPSRKQ